MSYEELVESRKNIGDMTKEELFTYCGGLLSEVWDYEKENEQLHNKVEELMELYTTERHCKDDYKAIIKEVKKCIDNITLEKLDDYEKYKMIPLKDTLIGKSILKILDKE